MEGKISVCLSYLFFLYDVVVTYIVCITLWGGFYMNKEIKRYVAMYLRVSTKDQFENGYGIDDQEIQCRKYINLYYPDENIKVYREEGKSAKDLNRPKMQEMLDELMEGNIKVIVAFKLDRLTRNVSDTYQLISKVMEQDCILVAVMDRLDISSANGRMLVGMLSIISQWEREVISERTIAAMIEIAREGKYPLPKCPFGWTKDRELRLHVQEERASIINAMADYYLEGNSLEQVSRYIKGKYQLYYSPLSIRNILSNSRLIGRWMFHNEEYTDVFPPIMEQEKFTSVQEYLQYRMPHAPEKKKYIFHGLVYCQCGQRCHHVSTKKKTKRFYYYYCPNCNERINQNKLVNQIVDEMMLHIKFDQLQKKIEQKKKSLEELQLKMLQLFKEYNENIMDTEVYNFTLKQYTKTKKEIENEIKCLEVESLDAFKRMSYEERYEYIHAFISKVIVDITKNLVLKVVYKSTNV